MEKILIPFAVGQQVKILPIKKKYCSPEDYYKKSIGIISETAIYGTNNYGYGVVIISGGECSGWWFPHECMKLMLDGKITRSNLEKAIEHQTEE